MNRVREPHLRMPTSDTKPEAQPPRQEVYPPMQAPVPPVQQQPTFQAQPPQQPYPPQAYQPQQQWGGGYSPQQPPYAPGYYGHPQQPQPYQQYPVTQQMMVQPPVMQQPMPDYDNSLDDPEPHAPRPSGWRVLLAVSGLVGIAGMSWLAYYWGPSYDGPPPLIPAPEGPYRIKPESPGGATIAYRDTLVYDRLSQNSSQASEEQNVVILPEEPSMTPPAHAQVPQEASPMQATPLAQMSQQPIEPQAIPASTPADPVTESQPQAQHTPQQDMDSMLAKLSDIQEIAPTGKPVYFLQMATLKSEAEAVKEMRRLKSKLHLQQSKWHVKKAETTSGKQYALLLGPYSSQEEAKKRCGTIKNGCKVVAAE